MFIYIYIYSYMKKFFSGYSLLSTLHYTDFGMKFIIISILFIDEN